MDHLPSDLPLQNLLSTAADIDVHRCGLLSRPLQISMLTAADFYNIRCKFGQHRCRLYTIRCNISLLYLCALDPTQPGLRPRELVNL